MKKALKAFAFLLTAVFVLQGEAGAHFLMLLPSEDIVSGGQVVLKARFLHPFEGQLMDMARPEEFGLYLRGERTDLLGTLRPLRQEGRRLWQAVYELRRPGDHVFYLKQAPYFEPSEGRFILQYAKVVVNAFALQEGWDAELGLEAEIVPLSRPYGLWAGNVFQGVVKMGGRPVPFALVEVQHYNTTGLKAPSEPFITQVLKADAHGVFTYAIPWEGWWGFAALLEAPYRLSHKGRRYPVELGAVLWVRARGPRR
jgi:cobalt/nickel transport protein